MNVESHIGQYRILRTLGVGGMGTVYLGEHILLGRRAAIKTLLPTLSSHREIVDRFFNEAKAISAISDPGVVQIFDFGYHVDGTAYIVMEYLEGESLSARLDRLHRLPLVEALRLTRQIAASLGAAHARGIIHRDLKPGNVFVIRDVEAQGGERTKILDFGIAKLATTSDAAAIVSATQTGTMLGTPVYMSPEQCRGAGQVDHRSDIYSVGCALFHMITGQPPFDCESVGDFIAAHLREPAPRPSSIRPDLPQAVDALLELCLAKKPDERFQSMGELQSAIEDVLANLADSERDITPAPVKETPLGAGFQSEYDVNRGDETPTPDEMPTPKPSKSWFVDSLAPVAASSVHDDEHAWIPPERGMSPFQRIALVGALFIGLLGGLAVTSYALGGSGEPARVPPQPAAATSSDVIGPATASVREVAPPEPVASAEEEADAIIEELLEEAGINEKVADPAGGDAAESEPAATFTQDAPATKKKPERPRPARTKWRPQPRRPAPAPQDSEPPPTEDDLYDTR